MRAKTIRTLWPSPAVPHRPLLFLPVQSSRPSPPFANKAENGRGPGADSVRRTVRHVSPRG